MGDQIGAVAVSSVSIQPKYVYGLRSNVTGNIHFSLKGEVIYPVAGVIAIHNFTTQKQKFLRLVEHHVPNILTISPNRKMLAIAEWNDKTEKCFIVNYDVATLTKKKTFKLPKEVPTREAAMMEFTQDSRGLAVLSKEPDAFLTIFYFDKSQNVIVGRVSNGYQKGLTAHVIACNLNDTGLVAVGGNFTFKLMSRQDKSFGTIGTLTGEHKIVTSLIWLTAEVLVAGTSANQLLFIEGGDPKFIFEANKVVEIDLEKAKDADDEHSSLGLTPISQATEKTHVNCLTYFECGFCFAQHNVLHVFQKDKLYVRYAKRSIIEIPINLYDDDVYHITNVSINSTMDTVVVTAKHSQIYISKLFEPETMSIQYFEFRMLGESLHIDSIISMSVCSWKKIIMTAARDLTVRMWNYQTGQVELVRKYQTHINVIALHPSGVFVAVGFSDQLRLMEVLLDDLKTIKAFNFPQCNEIVFSHQGHLVACAYQNLITVISVFSFTVLRTMKGHNGNVLSLAWSNDDEFITSSGADGAIYEWEIVSGHRVGESIQIDIEYRSVALTADRTTFTCTNTGIFREIHQSEIVREIRPCETSAPLTRLALARSDLMLFIGNEAGALYNVQVPFLDAGGGTCTNYRFFSSAITSMKLTFDDRYLACGSADGTLIVWIIANSEGKTGPVDDEHGKCSDIIVSRQHLIELQERLANLGQRINEKSEEFQYQLQHIAKTHNQSMEMVRMDYEAIIARQREERAALEAKHSNEKDTLLQKIAEINEAHGKQMVELEETFNKKLITEFEQSSALRTKIDEIKEEYEKLLRKSSQCLQKTIDRLQQSCKEQLDKQKEEIRLLTEEIKSKKSEFVQYCKQLHADNDRQLVDLKSKFEAQLKEADDAIVHWRTAAGIANRKIDAFATNFEQVKQEKSILVAEHEQKKQQIEQLLHDRCELQRELAIRDRIACEKDTKLTHVTQTIQQQNTAKKFLNRHIAELQSHIERQEKEIQAKSELIKCLEQKKRAVEKKFETFRIKHAYCG